MYWLQRVMRMLSYLLSRTCHVSYKKQELLTLRQYLDAPLIFGWVHLFWFGFVLQFTWGIYIRHSPIMVLLCFKSTYYIWFQWILFNITNLVCYTYFHWFFTPECQHIFGKQTGYIFQSPKTIKTWTTKHYASLNQWYNTE